MKAHLKRLVAPKTWPLLRKSAVFITRSLPGRHRTAMSLPLIMITRDLLQFARTAREARFLVRDKRVLIDNSFARDVRQQVGIMDTVYFPMIKKAYRLSLSKRGKLSLVEIDEKEANMKICGVRSKKIIKGNKTQLQCHDGRTLLSDKKIHIGDSLVLTLPKQEITQQLSLTKDALVFMLSGGHTGSVGKVQMIEGKNITLLCGDDTITTTADKFIVIGKEKPVHKVMPDE